MIGTPLTCGHWDDGVLKLRVRVKTRASRLELAGVVADRLQIRLTAPPADDAANQQARKLIARSFGVGISQVQLVSGARHREKVFHVTGPRQLPPGLSTNAAAGQKPRDRESTGGL